MLIKKNNLFKDWLGLRYFQKGPQIDPLRLPQKIWLSTMVAGDRNSYVYILESDSPQPQTFA